MCQFTTYILVGFPQISLTATYTLALPLTFLVSAASYYMVERPFVSLRRNFRRLDAPPPTVPDDLPNGSLVGPGATPILGVDISNPTSPQIIGVCG